MKLYCSTKWEERQRARDVMYELIAAGHKITHDWTIDESFSPYTAVEDVLGVKDADALVAIVEKDLPYQGTWVEVGVALGKPISVYLVGSYGTENVFTKHPLVTRVHNVEELLGVLHADATTR